MSTKKPDIKADILAAIDRGESPFMMEPDRLRARVLLWAREELEVKYLLY